MEGSFYNLNTLFVATKEPSGTFDPSLAPQSAQQQPSFGIYQEEESVDFSALVEACEGRNGGGLTGLSPVNFPTSGNGSASGPLSSSSFFEAESAFPFENLMPGVYGSGTENGGFQTPSLNEFPPNPSITSSSSSAQPTSLHQGMPMSSQATESPTSGKSKTGKISKKSLDKSSSDYREKRDRNNVAVRKSRIKSKQRVQETERRVKELEEENGQLQNKIALLTKELNVLKGLFASAGVPHPPIKMETDGGFPCGRKSD